MHSKSITDLVPTAISRTGQMAEWSDEKKADFMKTFEKRSAASRLILEMTADAILSIAAARKFTKHVNQITKTVSCGYRDIEEETGHTYQDLYKIAQEQAKAVLGGLPPLKKKD
jgi:hypothetical protein